MFLISILFFIFVAPLNETNEQFYNAIYTGQEYQGTITYCFDIS